MPITDSKQLGISASYFWAQLMISCLMSLKLRAFPLWLCLMNWLTVIPGSISWAVFSSTNLTISSTILAQRVSYLLQLLISSNDRPEGWHWERSECSHTLTLPSLSMHIKSSVTLKYPTLWYNFSNPQSELNSTYRFSGQGMSWISLSLTGMCSMYTLAVQLVLQNSLLSSQFRYLVLTMLSSLSLHWKNSRYFWNSARLKNETRYYYSYSLVRLLINSRQRPCSGFEAWRLALISVQLSFLKGGGLQVRESLFPI